MAPGAGLLSGELPAISPFPLAEAVASGQSVGQTTEPLRDAADAQSPTPRSGRGMAPAARAGCSPRPPRQSAAPQTGAWQWPTGQASATIRPASSSQPVSRGPQSAGSQNKPSIASRPIGTTRRPVTAQKAQFSAAPPSMAGDEAPLRSATRGCAKSPVALRDRPSLQPLSSACEIRGCRLTSRGMAESRARAAELDLVRGIVLAKAVPLPALGTVPVSVPRQPGFSPAG